MSAIKWLSGLFILFIVALSSAYNYGDPGLQDSQVVIVPNEDGTILEISVLTFASGHTDTGTTISQEMRAIIESCRDSPNFRQCIYSEGNSFTAGTDFNLEMRSVQDARITVTYYNALTGSDTDVPECTGLVTNTEGIAYTPSETGVPDEIPYYTTTCDISEIVEGQRTTTIMVIYSPDLEDGISASTAPYTYTNAHVTASSAITRQINDLILGLSSAQGTDIPIPLASPLPCVGIFLILGLLLSSLYFAGKSPISLLDIAAPRLPTPKGVAAGGQILTPFGYGELGRTTNAKLKASVAALELISRRLRENRLGGDMATNRLMGRIDSRGGTNEQRQVARSIVTAGRALGINAHELNGLADLPSNYREAHYQQIANIFERLRNGELGGAGRHLATTTQDALHAFRVNKTLSVLGGHPDMETQSKALTWVTKKMDVAFGSNRYAVIGPTIAATRGSIVRSSRLTGRLAKAIFTEAPSLVRGATKTTMEMIGGSDALRRLEAKGKTSRSAGWLFNQLTKHPSNIEIGHMFPIVDKMGYMYDSMRKEALRDSMRYVLRQFYRSKGVNFSITEEELSQMGHKDINILQKSGYLTAIQHMSADERASFHNAEKEFMTILGNKDLSSYEKLQKLIDLARTHTSNTIHIDSSLQMFTDKINNIHQSTEPDYVKMIQLQEQFEKQNAVRAAGDTGGVLRDDLYVCHVGGGTLRHEKIWETMVLRTMIWDAENGYMKSIGQSEHLDEQAGVKEALLSARLNVANRLATLDPTTGMDKLPEHMRNMSDLEAVRDRNKSDMMQLFSKEGLELFEQTTNKKMGQASIQDIVLFMYGANMPKSGHTDPKTGKMVYWGCDQELTLKKSEVRADVKRHWITKLDDRENFALGQWTESKFTRSYVPAFKASIEAQLKNMPGYNTWSVEEHQTHAKQLWVSDLLIKDMEQRFNSHFGQNTYGTTHESMRFYGGIAVGFLEKALEDKLPADHATLEFLKNIDMNNVNHLRELGTLLSAHRQDFEKIIHDPVTYEQMATGKKPMVMLHEGGFAYYHKGMALSDMDRLVNAEVALKDNNGVSRVFIAEEVSINLNDKLIQEFYKLKNSRSAGNPEEWSNLIENARAWASEGRYNYEREKQFAALVWEYSNATNDFHSFYNKTKVFVDSRREVTPAAPMMLRFFGIEGSTAADAWKHAKKYGFNVLDYITKVSLLTGGPVHDASYDITPVSEQFRRHSMYMASNIMANVDMKDMTAEERAALRNAAMQHAALHQVWDYAIDRHPGRTSAGYGTHASWASGFHFGPAQNFSVKDNLGSYMSKGEYLNFMVMYGFSLDLASKMLAPYTNIIRGVQMSMQGYSNRWGITENPLKMYDYTTPRMQEAMQAANPFSFRWFEGKTFERIAKLNVFGGSLEHHQLAGPDFFLGLRQAPQDLFLTRKGVYAVLRTGEANPGLTHYDYRHTLRLDQAMGEYLMRNRDVAYMYDEEVKHSAFTNTVRRTVAAEALGIRRRQELNNFGALQNPLYGWANPIAFLWHLPPPGVPDGLAPRDLVTRWVGISKRGHDPQGGFLNQFKRAASSFGNTAKSFSRPDLTSRQVHCNCGRTGIRGTRCQNCGICL
ncbi:hypothetical protein KKF81_00115 [Candidatus Micrarchaeota archaeon]|nr:hypothetical protein [Candidatus Micrarchaeota archaeon]MBU1165321.1 hypothetical protein [Candidatus Micrarchaeota archaeon]MBU1887116.1 hypothetical protein [Candidatus Micrarchaeota archaeon]